MWAESEDSPGGVACEDSPGGVAWCSSSRSVLRCLWNPKNTKKRQAKVQELIWDTLPVFLREGGVSVLYLRPGEQETLREAGTEGQEEEEEQEEAHREQQEH